MYDATTLLGPEDPPPFEIVNPGGSAACLIVCDHASHEIPRALDDLGIDAADRHAHIAWDIGAAVMARRLSELFDAPALLAGYSRLVVDCNRYPSDPAAFVQESDSVGVPGNIEMPDAQRERRVDEVFRPYHDAIDAALKRFEAAGEVPAFISVHTMTDRMRGERRREQEFNLCWAKDDRLALPVLERLRALGDVCVGDNEPYALDLGEDYTVPEHAMRRGLPHLQFEVRQDLVRDDEAARRWADLIHATIAHVLISSKLSAGRRYWP